MPSMRVITGLLIVTFAVSVIHYTDNTINYADYPSNGPVPDPGQTLVGLSWFLFTAFGLAGYLLLRRGRRQAAAICLAVYSGSGLAGIAHYTIPGATDMVWWRQAHVISDIVCGIAVFALAMLLIRAPQPEDAASGEASR